MIDRPVGGGSRKPQYIWPVLGHNGRNGTCSGSGMAGALTFRPHQVTRVARHRQCVLRSRLACSDPPVGDGLHRYAERVSHPGYRNPGILAAHRPLGRRRHSDGQLGGIDYGRFEKGIVRIVGPLEIAPARRA